MLCLNAPSDAERLCVQNVCVCCSNNSFIISNYVSIMFVICQPKHLKCRDLS